MRAERARPLPIVWLLRWVIGLGVMVAACTSPLRTGVFVHNASGGVARVTTEWSVHRVEETLPPGQVKSVMTEHYKGCSRDPQLGPGPITVTIVSEDGHEEVYDRDRIWREATWLRDGRKWMITVGPHPGATPDGGR